MNKNADGNRAWAQGLLQEARRLLSTGRPKEAEAVLGQILAQNPRELQALFGLGMVAAQTGQAELAAQRFQQVLALDANNIPALCWMATLSYNADRLPDASRYAKQAVALEPRNAVMHTILARCASAANDIPTALQSFEAALALTPNDPTLQYDYATTLISGGHEREAAIALRKLLSAQSNPTAELRLAFLELGLGRNDEAERLCEKALLAEPNHAQGHALMGRILMEQHRLDDAEDHWQQALELDPASTTLNFQRALSLNAIGRFDEAIKELERSIAANPIQGQAYQGIVFNKKITEADRPLVQRMKALLEEPALTENDRLSLLYSLGKSSDSLGEFAQAMEYFDAANALKLKLRRSPVFDRAAFKGFIDSRIAMFSKERLQEFHDIGIESSLPILIVGMMRSGTTLAEQMLSCHPLVGGAGEQHFWGDQENSMIDFQRKAVDTARVRTCANEFVGLLSSLAPGFPYVIDKNPANLQVLGSFRIGFPNARILHMRRDAVDTALSIWMTPMKSDAPFLHDKASIVFAYKECMRLMEHWRAVFPADRYMEVRYESLVDRPVEEIRAVLAFCGLEWDEACAHPENNDKRIKTPSMWQARQPVYRTSTEKWRRYEKWLGPFVELAGTF